MEAKLSPKLYTIFYKIEKTPFLFIESVVLLFPLERLYMNYVSIIDIIFGVIYSLVALFTIHFAFFAIVGLFAKKKFPKAKVQHKYGIIIPARNEEAVVGNLIKSVYKNKYPQDKLHVFVIAHNCTDKTAQIARELGATVYEYNNPDERTMGYAFRYLFDQIRKDYGVQNYDGFFLFNADNILSADYFEKMNDAFDATGGQSVITSFRNSKNFGTNMISGMYGLYFMSGCRLESRGRTALGCSTRVQGCGYVVNSKIVENGWPYVTLTEDWEFTADQVINNTKIQFCDDAVFYDEQPTTFKIMWRQRVRWSRGHLLVLATRFKDLIKSFFSPKYSHRNKVSLYDIFINCTPICLVTFGIGLAQFICYMFAPLAGVAFNSALLHWLRIMGWSMLIFYISCFVNAVIIFIAERKRIKDVPWWKKILMCFIWPLFILIQFPIDIVALFQKNCGWKVIPHTDTTNFEKLNNMEEEVAHETSEASTETKQSTVENSEI